MMITPRPNGREHGAGRRQTLIAIAGFAARRAVALLLSAGSLLAVSIQPADAPSLAGAHLAVPATALPNPCQLLDRDQAEALAGLELQPASHVGPTCTYNSYPTGATAQVFIDVSLTIPQTLLTDRALHHKFWPVPHLGDKALAEQWAIFVRQGGTWVTISLVRIDNWQPYEQRLVRAAAIATSRLKDATPKSGPGHQAAVAVHSMEDRVATPSVAGLGRASWTGAERRYGGSITHYPGVVYQPDVVVIGGGANAISAESPNGLTWTIDARAPGAAELHVGSIMLATTFASGRVVALSRTGTDLRVTVVPVALTDVIADGTFQSAAPIALQQPLDYSTALSDSPSNEAAPEAALFAPEPFTGRVPGDLSSSRLPAGAAPSAAGFTTKPICCAGAVGVDIGYDSTYGRLSAVVQLHWDKPTVSFKIRISAGHLVEASLQLHGVGGLSYYIFAATLKSSGDVKSIPIEVPGSITIPLVGPLAITLSQSFDVSMQLAGAATLKASGDYKVSGDLGFSLGSAGPHLDQASMSTEEPITSHTLSLSVGVNALSLGWAMRATVGLGLGGLTAGAWVQFTPGLAIAADGSNNCVTASLSVTSKFGVGWSVPDFVRSVVNSVLGALHVAPIPKSGGPSWGPSPVWQPPQSQYCLAH